jgi:copper type II ascorbate-dependent monooxygenase-like protein
MRLVLASLLLFAACGTDTTPSTPDAPGGSPGYTPLVSGNWSMGPSSETYRCVRLTATSDMWITAIHPIAPTGTHHTVLMLGPPDAADGDVACDSSLVKPSIYASGVGTDALVLPDGVAIKVAAGQQLLLNLHLFNASDAPLSGASGIEVKLADHATIVHEAGALLAGKDAGLVVKPGMSIQTGTCSLPAGTTVFAMAPHMHLLGIHLKVTYQAAAPQVLYDKDYTFDGQRYDVLGAPVTSDGTNKLVVDCSYMNPTATTVRFGEHTTDEMCYALALVYPAPTTQGGCDH